jgi:phage gp46-like protein
MDIALHLNKDNQADITVSNGLVATDAGIATAINISLFGANIDGTAWWGNELDDNVTNNLTNEFLQLQGKTLISANLPIFQESIKKNLAWITADSIASGYTVECSITDINTLQINIVIEDLDFKFQTYAIFE